MSLSTWVCMFLVIITSVYPGFSGSVINQLCRSTLRQNSEGSDLRQYAWCGKVNRAVMFILDYVHLVPLIAIHIIPKGSQYAVDVMRCIHEKVIADDILLWLQSLCLRLDLDHGDYHAETSKRMVGPTSRNLVAQSTCTTTESIPARRN